MRARIRRSHFWLALLGAAAAAALGAAARAQQGQEMTHVSATAHNPDPASLPTLTVWGDDKFSPGRTLTMVRAVLPNVPGFICESWCYESPVEFLDARPLEGGRLELRHRLNDLPQVLLVTEVTPGPGSVEFTARLQLENPGQGALPANPWAPNMCWQVRRADGFRSAPDPFPDWVKRCFIFTEKGRTFLGDTTRRRIPCRPANDPYNNPPWVQSYVGTWMPVPTAGPTSWADYSPDRYVTPIIGVVSRDGRYLAALVNNSADSMAQAWHDCLHNNPKWLPAEAPVADRRWRVKAYVMENDPAALLARVAKDWPKAGPRQP
jgi:hypothetical protein